jgi:Protein of unknown function (DUF3105)
VAKKARTPRPPRPVQAPTRRADTRSGGGFASLPKWSWAVGGAAVVGLALVAAFAFGRGGSSGPSDAGVARAMAAAGCTYKAVPPKPPKKNQTNYHADVPTLSTPTKGLWSTFPPSGGAHYGLWAVWGFYRQPVNPRQVVHNEEHGAVAIWWGPEVPSSTVDQLERFYQQKPEGMMGTPLAGLGKKIALTAWTGDPSKYYRNGDFGIGHVSICSKFDQKAFAAFRDAFRGHGPEGIPLSSDVPGSGPT